MNPRYFGSWLASQPGKSKDAIKRCTAASFLHSRSPEQEPRVVREVDQGVPEATSMVWAPIVRIKGAWKTPGFWSNPASC